MEQLDEGYGMATLEDIVIWDEEEPEEEVDSQGLLQVDETSMDNFVFKEFTLKGRRGETKDNMETKDNLQEEDRAEEQEPEEIEADGLQMEDEA